ncbi:hypothetical protein APUTEX25_003714, partial [Auxenochlorella protothecoides]
PGLEACRISEPSEVQISAIPVLLSGRNAAIQSYTGSGKTLAYLLPILTLISRRQAEGSRAPGSRARGSKATDGPAAIVVAPSHELAMQIVRVAQSFFDPDQRRRVQQCIGGASTWRQQEALKEHRPWLVRALVFMNFQDRLRDVQGKLEARGMPAASLHGELSKQERQATLAAFTAGRFRALLVSDVAARGLDIPDCDAVFNLELPTDASHYAHRAGRTARAGRSGVVVSLVSGGQSYVVQRFGKRLGVDIQPVEFRHGVVERVREDQLAPPRKAAGGGPKAEGTGQAAPLALKATRKTAKKGYRSH